MTSPLEPNDVQARLSYARVRVDNLLALNRGDLLGADAHKRQRLTQEVFFHLVGAIEVFAQLVNERRGLGRASEDISISGIKQLLPAGDGLIPHVDALYSNTRHSAPASDPYTGDGLMYRVWNYRHQVTHRRANPFHANVTLAFGPRSARRGAWHTTLLHGLQRSTPAPDRSGHFKLDPRDPNGPPSVVTVQLEVDAMYGLVKEKLEAAIAAL